MIDAKREVTDLFNFLLLNAGFSSDDSLGSGRLAVALFFHYARATDLVPAHPELASGCLDELLSEESQPISTSYATGIAGVGVILEHLVQTGLSAHDPDLILKRFEPYSIDQQLAEAWTIDIASGVSGLGLYTLHRLKGSIARKTPLQYVFKRHLLLCIEEIAGSLPRFIPDRYLNAGEASIWNGLTGVLTFLTAVRRMGLSNGNCDHIEQAVALKLIQSLTRAEFCWSKAESIFGLLNCTMILTDTRLRYKVLDSFESFINVAYKNIETIDLYNAAYVSLLIKILGIQYNHDRAILLSEAICNKVLSELNETTIPGIFAYNQELQTFPMGMFRGVCGTALPLLSLQSGNYSWLEIVGIDTSRINNPGRFPGSQSSFFLTRIQIEDHSAKRVICHKKEQEDILSIPLPENGLIAGPEHCIQQFIYAQNISNIIYPYLQNKQNLIFWTDSISFIRVYQLLKERYSSARFVYVHQKWTSQQYLTPPKEKIAYETKMALLANIVFVDSEEIRQFFIRALKIPPDKLLLLEDGAYDMQKESSVLYSTVNNDCVISEFTGIPN